MGGTMVQQANTQLHAECTPKAQAQALPSGSVNPIPSLPAFPPPCIKVSLHHCPHSHSHCCNCCKTRRPLLPPCAHCLPPALPCEGACPGACYAAPTQRWRPPSVLPPHPPPSAPSPPPPPQPAIQPGHGLRGGLHHGWQGCPRTSHTGRGAPRALPPAHTLVAAVQPLPLSVCTVLAGRKAGWAGVCSLTGR